MPTTIETKYKRKITELVRKNKKFNHVMVMNFAGSFYQERGIPDSVFIINGLVIFVEWKDHNTKIDPLQERKRKEIIKHGGNSFVVRFNEKKTEFIIDDQFSVKYKKLEEGLELLFDTLQKLSFNLY